MRISRSLKNGASKGDSRIAFTRSSDYSIARRKMVEELFARGIQDEKVLRVMGEIPRHLFVDEALISQAYQDSPLNIGLGQTISQPFTVALLAQALHLNGSEEILEIGTGCGYQTAVLAALARRVYSIERISSLLLKARTNLRRLGIKNVVLKLGDGSRGWPERGPFQAVVAAAVSPQVPKPLLDQLGPDGRLVLPVERDAKQFLIRMTRGKMGFEEQLLGECRFVKMVGHHAFGEKVSKVGRELSRARGLKIKARGAFRS
jgi:protein-L-isoaspartate(D-aspartate) O-methyltransferase